MRKSERESPEPVPQARSSLPSGCPHVGAPPGGRRTPVPGEWVMPCYKDKLSWNVKCTGQGCAGEAQDHGQLRGWWCVRDGDARGVGVGPEAASSPPGAPPSLTSSHQKGAGRSVSDGPPEAWGCTGKLSGCRLCQSSELLKGVLGPFPHSFRCHVAVAAPRCLEIMDK